MRLKIFKSVFPILCVLALFSCEDWLDKQPTGDMTLDDVFADRIYTQRFLSNIYSRLPVESDFADIYQGIWFCGNPFVGGCDEMEIAFGGAYSHEINQGSWNSTNVLPIWTESYNAIRECNIFLERVNDVPTTQEEKNEWSGEAYFLRAFYHFMLMRTHGPIIILDHTVKTDADFKTYKRSPIQKVASFIATDCDRAAGLLEPKKGATEYGRATSIAALALKSRVLLYAASPLYNGNSDYAGFKNPDGEQLIPSGEPDLSLWQKAADAALFCMEEAKKNGYGLYYSSTGDPYDNYADVWQVHYNEEWIFWRQCGDFRHPDQCADPISFRNSASIINPTQEIVDAYEMADGSTPIVGYQLDGDVYKPIINQESGYSEDHFVTEPHPQGYHPAGVWSMYANREPRFYASINFCLQEWKESTLQFYYSGKDGKSRAGSDYCKTGYLMRKLVDASYRSSPPVQVRNHHWVYFRVGELYLNYAEALNEAQGPVAEVYTYVNEIRKRAGLPDLPDGLSKEEMRAKIHHERRIELAFETHRFFDVRRWKEAENTENRQIHSMNIYAGANATDPAYYERKKVENRVFERKHYLFPIPQDEINMNIDNLVQNPDW